MGIIKNNLFFYKSTNKKKILPDTEGFIRQLNWREYSRLLYIYAREDMIRPNYFSNNRRLSIDWCIQHNWNLPIDLSIRQAFRYGYLHHIV